MSFVLQRSSGRGVQLTQVRANTLRVGRGTNAELRSENPAVALEHATITGDETGYTITDNGSITGTYVNGRPVESARLAKNDVIDVGDLRLEVQVAEARKPLYLKIGTNEVAPVQAAADQTGKRRVIAGVGALTAPKVDYADAYRLRRPYLTKLTIICALLIVALVSIGEVTKPERRTAFMPGGVSSAHSRARDPATGKPIAENCAACHDPWKGVSDAKCEECHTQAPHSILQTTTPRCVDCHLEHRGATQLAVIADQKCVACHGNLPAHRKTNVARIEMLPAAWDRVPNFDNHPEFPPQLDRDTLRFNHKLHLMKSGILNGKGQREVLTCTMCHRLVDTKGKLDPKPVTFANDCQRCHRLTFDPRFPTAEVPHGGEPGLAYGFILQTYAGNRDLASKSPDEIRRILSHTATTTADEHALFNAEQIIKVKCALCHEMTRVDQRLTAVTPVLPMHWYTHAQFSHTAHRDLDCESCHARARNSSLTSDVLLPGRDACVACHGTQAAVASSRCVTCHEYHESSKTVLTKLAKASGRISPRAARSDVAGGGGMIETVLLIAVAALILVIVVPVGVFIYQRLVASAPPIPSVKSMQPPPAQPPITGPTPAVPSPPPPSPAPAAPAPEAPQPAKGETRVIEPGELGGAPPQATEMVQWYGMLRCTAGPLNGQTFIIEEDGFYIGRDGSLSQVVINDSRVSKRHVRIHPRNGKVMAIDQNSTNGTFLGQAGGQRITEVQLKRGDVLVLADNAATFTYQI